MRPPTPHNNSEYIINVFVILVASILILLTVVASFLAVFTNKDIKPFFTIILEMVKTLIAALVGYLAGKAVGRNGTNGESKS